MKTTTTKRKTPADPWAAWCIMGWVLLVVRVSERLGALRGEGVRGLRLDPEARGLGFDP